MARNSSSSSFGPFSTSQRVAVDCKPTEDIAFPPSRRRSEPTQGRLKDEIGSRRIIQQTVRGLKTAAKRYFITRCKNADVPLRPCLVTEAPVGLYLVN